jgi:ElaB/YqjD/DUF883 family membrane-anchored ribosome-binding protein
MSENASPEPDTQRTHDVHLAADAVRLAKAELEKAQAMYEKVRQHTAERIKTIRGASLGDAIDKTLVAVKRHPGAGLTIAALIGFLLGRLFRR